MGTDRDWIEMIAILVGIGFVTGVATAYAVPWLWAAIKALARSIAA